MMPDATEAPGSPRPESRARDHLANERTFLAWVRTALGLIGVGFVLARMGVFLRQLATVAPQGGPRQEFRGSHEFLTTGIVFLMVGTAICAGSGWIYHRSRAAIEAGRFEPARRAVTAPTAVVVLGGLVITGLLLRQLATPGG